MRRNDNGSFPPDRVAPLGWCDAGGHGLGYGCKGKVGDKVTCLVCGRSVVVAARFGDQGWPAYPRHKMPKDAKPPVSYLTHPWKVEAREYSSSVHRAVLVGRAMFGTREEAEKWAAGGERCVVSPSRPGDMEFA